MYIRGKSLLNRPKNRAKISLFKQPAGFCSGFANFRLFRPEMIAFLSFKLSLNLKNTNHIKTKSPDKTGALN
jgi:hypothetical protein